MKREPLTKHFITGWHHLDLIEKTNILFQKNVVPGSKINLTGILRDIAMRVDDGRETRRRDIFLEANYLTVIEERRFCP